LVNTHKQARHVSLCAPIVNHGLFRQCSVGKHYDMGNIKKRYTGLTAFDQAAGENLKHA
jgi:hypothetical protein